MMQAPDDPARKLKARAAEAGGVQPLAERPNREELTRRLSKLRRLRLGRDARTGSIRYGRYGIT